MKQPQVFQPTFFQNHVVSSEFNVTGNISTSNKEQRATDQFHRAIGEASKSALQQRHHDQGGGQLIPGKYPNALRTTHHESSKLTDKLVKLQRNDQQLLEPGGTRQLLSPRRTREQAEEAEAATGSIQSQRWQQIRQDTKQNMEQPLQSANELTDDHERTST